MYISYYILEIKKNPKRSMCGGTRETPYGDDVKLCGDGSKGKQRICRIRKILYMK